MAFAEDLTVFFNAQEFAHPALLSGVAVSGIFDEAYGLGAVGLSGMSSTVPAYTLPTASIIGEPYGQPLVIGSRSFVVAAHEPDGTGISRLLLELAP